MSYKYNKLENNILENNILEPECVICLDTLNENVKKLECEHYFHANCIDEWVNGHFSCPLCRKVVSNKFKGTHLPFPWFCLFRRQVIIEFHEDVLHLSYIFPKKYTNYIPIKCIRIISFSNNHMIISLTTKKIVIILNDVTIYNLSKIIQSKFKLVESNFLN